MHLRGLAPTTQRSYIHYVADFAKCVYRAGDGWWFDNHRNPDGTCSAHTGQEQQRRQALRDLEGQHEALFIPEDLVGFEWLGRVWVPGHDARREIARGPRGGNLGREAISVT